MSFLFYEGGAVALISTLFVILQTNVVHALIYLVLSLLAVAVVFFSLGAPFRSTRGNCICWCDHGFISIRSDDAQFRTNNSRTRESVATAKSMAHSSCSCDSVVKWSLKQLSGQFHRGHRGGGDGSQWPTVWPLCTCG